MGHTHTCGSATQHGATDKQKVGGTLCCSWDSCFHSGRSSQGRPQPNLCLHPTLTSAFSALISHRLKQSYWIAHNQSRSISHGNHDYKTMTRHWAEYSITEKKQQKCKYRCTCGTIWADLASVPLGRQETYLGGCLHKNSLGWTQQNNLDFHTSS